MSNRIFGSMEHQVFNRIKAVLAEQGRTSKWLYEEMGVSKITMSLWARNARQPSIENLFQMAAKLEVSPCELLVNENPFVVVGETEK